MPVEGSPLLMCNGKNPNLCLPKRIYHCIGELAKNPASNPSFCKWSCFGKQDYIFNRFLNVIKEGHSQSGAFEVIKVRSIVQFIFCIFVKRNSPAHLKRFLARLKTSSAGRICATPRSISSSLRMASSIHNCSISASDSVSRLTRSSFASSARDLGLIFKASAFNSSKLILNNLLYNNMLQWDTMGVNLIYTLSFTPQM